MSRRILSLWLPYWPTERLLRQNPQLAKAADGAADGAIPPLVLYAPHQGRERVLALDGAGLQAGLALGMRLADARALVPNLRTHRLDPAADAAALRRLADWCENYSPWVAVDHSAPPDPNGVMFDHGLKLDVSGCAHLFGGEAALAAAMQAGLAGFGVTARLAIADNLGAAWAAARYGGQAGEERRIMAVDGARAGLAELPLAALRLESDQVAGLFRLGLRRIGDLYKLPRATLAARFGADALLRLDQALGRQGEALSPHAPARHFWARLGFAEPIGQGEDIARAAQQLCHDLAAQLAAAGRGARRLQCRLFLIDHRVECITVGLSRPNRTPDHLFRLLAEHLPTLEATFGAEAMSLSAPLSDPLAAQQGDFAEPLDLSPSNPSISNGYSDGKGLALLLDRLANRLGNANLFSLGGRESHLPEAAVLRLPPLSAKSPSAISRATITVPRPVRLLARPEAIEAMAELPDGPPRLFRWRGRLRRVIRAEGPERIAPEWWRAKSAEQGLSQASLTAAARDYFAVETTDGARFWLYRRGLYESQTTPAPDAASDATPAPNPRWYLHGFFG